jgi:hypothetical protein
VFETPNAYVCERAVGPERSCDFRSGRTILQRVVERQQMTKLLETGKSDLLQFVSARTRRPFSAFLVRGADGKIGFEFAPREGGRAARGAARAPLRVLGRHPRDGQPVELHAGRYGPYVKHGALNATLADKAQIDTLTLDQAVQLLDERAAREGGSRAPRGTARTAPPPRGARHRAMEPAPATTRSAAKPAAKPIRPRAAAAKTKPAATKAKSATAKTKSAAAKSKPVAAKTKPIAAKSKAAAKPAARAKPSATARAPAVAKPAIPLAKRKPAVTRTRVTAAKRKAARG